MSKDLVDELSECIRLSQQGDEEAFDRLLDEQYGRIYRFAYKWCGNIEDAEDITQQSCIKLAKSITQFRFDSAFSSWLYRLVINCSKDWSKAQSRHSLGESVEIQELSDEYSSDGEQGIYLEQVLLHLERMAEGFKETALLVFAEGFTHQEVANVLGIQESTVSWRIHEIRKQLQALKQEGQL